MLVVVVSMATVTIVSARFGARAVFLPVGIVALGSVLATFAIFAAASRRFVIAAG